MSSKSNDYGRAFEYITLITLAQAAAQVRKTIIDKNSSFFSAMRAWNSVSTELKNDLTKAAEAAVVSIFDLEPMIIEDGDDTLELLIQPDVRGEEGDVRDILIIRRKLRWEIGLSLKHNHFAVKHSRLAKNLDFGSKWFGIPCSQAYWNDAAPVFNELDNAKRLGLKWRELPDKENDVYIPLLNAFVNEIIRSNAANPNVPSRMVEYLLGAYDFYKVISIDAGRTTQILTFNLRGTLNQPGRHTIPKIKIPTANLPTRIVSIGLKPGSNNTVELYMNEGWQFSFRIHNASTDVEASLKFDIQITGMPTTIVSINRVWY